MRHITDDSHITLTAYFMEGLGGWEMKWGIQRIRISRSELRVLKVSDEMNNNLAKAMHKL